MKHALAAFLLSAFTAMAVAQVPPAPTATDVERQDHADEQTQSREKCLGATATRIKRPDDPCSDPGRQYSREELRRTGEVDTARALEKLDPSIKRRR